MRALLAAFAAARSVRMLEAELPAHIANADNSVNGMVLESVYEIGLRHPEHGSLEDFEPFVRRHAMGEEQFRRKLQAHNEKRRLQYFPNPTPNGVFGADPLPNGMASGDRRTQVMALADMNAMVYPLRNVTNWKYPASDTDAAAYGTEMLAHPDGMIIGDWQNASTGVEWQLSAGEEQKAWMDKLHAAYHQPNASTPTTFTKGKMPDNGPLEFSLGLTYGVYKDAENTVIVFRGTDDGSDFANLMVYLEGWILEKQGKQLLDMWVTDLGLEITPEMAARKAAGDAADLKWRIIMHSLVSVFQTQQNKKFYDAFGKDGIQYMINGFWPLTKSVVEQVLDNDTPGKKLWITGHSQGGSRAHWASMWLRTKKDIIADTVTFGAVGYQCAVRFGLPIMYEQDMNVRMNYDNIIDFVNVLDHSARADWQLGKTCWLGVDAARDVNSAVHQYSARLVGYGGAELLMSGLLLRQPQRIKHVHYTHMEWAIMSLLQNELSADGASTTSGCFVNKIIPENDPEDQCPACRSMRCRTKLAHTAMFGVPHARLGEPHAEGDAIVENTDAAAGTVHPCLYASDDSPSLFSWLDLTRADTAGNSTADLTMGDAYQSCLYLGSDDYMMFGFQEIVNGAVKTEMVNVAFYYKFPFLSFSLDRRGSLMIRTLENGDVELALIMGNFNENSYDEVLAGTSTMGDAVFSTTLKRGEKKCLSETIGICTANVPDEAAGRRLLGSNARRLSSTSSLVFAMGPSSWGQIKLGSVSESGTTFSVESASDADLSTLTEPAAPSNPAVLTDAVRLGARLTVTPHATVQNNTALGSFDDIRAHVLQNALVSETLLKAARAASGSPAAIILGTHDLSSNDANTDGEYEVLVQMLIGTESAAASEVLRADLAKDAAATAFRAELAKETFLKIESLTLSGLTVLHKPSLAVTFDFQIPATVDVENLTLKNQAKYAFCAALSKTAGPALFPSITACKNEIKNLHIAHNGAAVNAEQPVTLDASLELASAAVVTDVAARIASAGFEANLSTELAAAMTTGYVSDSLVNSSTKTTGFTGLEPAEAAHAAAQTTAHQDKGLSDGAVAAVIICCLILTFFAGMAVMFFWKRADRKPLTDLASTQNV